MRKIIPGLVTVALCAIAFNASARFVSSDPVQADPNTGQNFNRYYYANNNPYRFTDPDGRQALDYSAKFLDLNRRHGSDADSMHQEMSEGLNTGLTITGGVVLLAVPDPSDLAIGAAFGRLALGMRASRGFSQAKRYIESVADSLGATGGRSGRRTAEFEGQGGGSGAARLFDRLTRGESTPRDGGRLGSLGDGSRIQTSTRTLRDGTRETSVRITSERTGSRIKDVVKVRFREKPE